MTMAEILLTWPFLLVDVIYFCISYAFITEYKRPNSFSIRIHDSGKYTLLKMVIKKSTCIGGVVVNVLT